MDAKRLYEYKRQIHLLKEKYKQTTLRVQNELNRMDAREKELEKETRRKLLARENFEIEYDDENYMVVIIFYDDAKELTTSCRLWGEHFVRMEYGGNSPNPTCVVELGEQNIFQGDNREHWEDYEVFEIFYKHILEFGIKIENY